MDDARNKEGSISSASLSDPKTGSREFENVIQYTGKGSTQKEASPYVSRTSSQQSAQSGQSSQSRQSRQSRRSSIIGTIKTINRVITGEEDEKALHNYGDMELPLMGNGLDYPPSPGEKKFYTVGFEGSGDPMHPWNWKSFKKVTNVMAASFFSLTVSLGSAMFSQGTDVIVEKFHVGRTVATLGVSFYVLGFASGPIVWAPLSEMYGRKAVFLPSCLGFVCFTFGVATGKDIQTIMLCRFFSGFFGASALVLASSTIADVFSPSVRGKAMASYSMAVFGGPMLGPIFGGFTVKSARFGWRWTSYWCGILGSIALILLTFVYQESYPPVVLKQKAKMLRNMTGNWAIVAPQEEDQVTMKDIFVRSIGRPVYMLFTELILLLISIYAAFIYGLLYMLLTAMPIIFGKNYGFIEGVAELPYLSMLIGSSLGCVMCILCDMKYRKMMLSHGRPIPEGRLLGMMVGSFFFAGGLFWLCWGGDFPDSVHWMVPTVGVLFVGFGLVSIFQSCINYLVDCYLKYAASAVAANSILRSICGAVFPLFAYPMFMNLHVKWAGTLLGCIGVILIPVPFVFFKYGHLIRKNSRFTSNDF